MARFLVTGGAGFIGSNLVEALLERGEDLRVIEDFSTGRHSNIEKFKSSLTLFDGSICDEEILREAFDGVDYCLHLAAIPSVPRSIEDPVSSNRVNIEGTLKVFMAAHEAGVKRVVCASSSAVYGNTQTVPSHEALSVAPISPYGVTKATNELYASVCSELYHIDIVCLRYFNVFGPRQDPDSPYSAVIPLFVRSMLEGKQPTVDGDGQQSRDFSHVDNIIHANLLACAAERPIAGIYNIACGASASILDLVSILNKILGTQIEPDFRDARPGDIRRSWADLSRATEAFAYAPTVSLEDGLKRVVEWYRNEASAR